MFSRISSAATCVILASCGSAGEDRVAAVPPQDRIECAIAGAPDFARDCALERVADGSALTVRHGDGGFRRFALSPDLTISAADGATALSGTALPDGRLEVVIDGDRYRLPPK